MLTESQRSVHLEYLSKCVKAVINLKLTHRCNYYWTTYSLHMCVNLQSSLYTNFKEYLIVYLNTMAVPDLRQLRAIFKLRSLQFRQTMYYIFINDPLSNITQKFKCVLNIFFEKQNSLCQGILPRENIFFYNMHFQFSFQNSPSEQMIHALYYLLLNVCLPDLCRLAFSRLFLIHRSFLFDHLMSSYSSEYFR